MKKLTHLSLVIATSVLLLSGCQNKKGLSHGDTVVNTGIVPSKDYVVDGEAGNNPEGFFNAANGGVGNGANGELDTLTPRESQMTADQLNSLYCKENILCAVHYNFDESAIAPSERPILEDVANKLREDPKLRLLIVGHCDWHGTAEYNLGLGERRAKGVVNFLTSLGIDAGRFETLSRGDLEATRGLSKEEGRKDRRSDIVQIKQ